MAQTGPERRGLQIGLILALVAFALALVGLGSQAAAAGESAEASRAATVSIANFTFRPGTLTIAKGSKVVFANDSKVSHTATRGGSFDTGVIRPGRTATVRFGQKGSFAYHCEIHPSMHGKIVVD